MTINKRTHCKMVYIKGWSCSTDSMVNIINKALRKKESQINQRFMSKRVRLNR